MMDKVYSTLCSCLRNGSPSSDRGVTEENPIRELSKFKGLHSVEDPIECLEALSHNQIICGNGDGQLITFNCKSGAVVEWKGHDKAITKICATNASEVEPTRIFTSSRDLSIKMWNLQQNKECQQEFKGLHKLVISAVAYNPGFGAALCSGSRDTSVALWDVSSGVVVTSTKIARNLVTDLCWNGQILAQTSEDKSLRLWDSRTLECVHTFIKKQQILTSCDVNGSQIVTSSGGFNGTGCEITLWDSRGGTMPVHEFKGHTEKASQCCFVTDANNSARYVASVSADRTIKMWNCDTLTEQSSFDVGNQAKALTQLPVKQSSSLRFGVSVHDSGVKILTTEAEPYADWQIFE